MPLPSFPRKRESITVLPYTAAILTTLLPSFPTALPSFSSILPSFPRKRESRPVLPYTAAVLVRNRRIPAYAGMTVIYLE